MATSTDPLHLRVFLSSPGDVGEERAIARSVLLELQESRLLRGAVTIEVVAWEYPTTPMNAGETPQLSVNRYNPRPSECDLVVVILWGRLGTPLPPTLTRDDGSRYRSGTEWEFEDARRASRPIFVYRRTEKPRVDIDDPDAASKRDQFTAVQAFLDRVSKHDDGSLRGGINPYATTADFRTQFRTHIEAETRRRLENAGRSAGSATDDRFSIFLATAADDLRFVRLGIATALEKDATVRVFNEVPPPLEREPHADNVRAHVESADLCVHLLGTEPGPPVEWVEPGSTYVLEQAKIGLERGNSVLVLHQAGFKPNGINEGSPYGQFLHELAQRQDSQGRLELVITARPQMVDAIRAKKRKLEEQRRREAATRIYIDLNQRDIAAAAELQAYCATKAETVVRAAGNDPLTRMSSFEDQIKESRLVIVVFGAVAKTWVDNRVEAATKFITSRQLATRVVVWLLGPPKPPGSATFPCPVIDSSATFDARALEDLLAPADA